MPMSTRGWLVLLPVAISACGGGGPTAPTNTRIIAVSGNLAFGTVTVGQEVSSTMTISNSGNATLTVTGLSAGGGGVYTASSTTASIPPSGSKQITVFFAPTAAINYASTLTVVGDQTSGNDSIAISGTGRTVALSAEAYCATFPTTGFGHLFYCGTNQGNLQLVNFPDGARGFCNTASNNSLGLVGFTADLFNGGIFTVESQSTASSDCNSVGSNCAGVIRCTRQ